MAAMCRSRASLVFAWVRSLSTRAMSNFEPELSDCGANQVVKRGDDEGRRTDEYPRAHAHDAASCMQPGRGAAPLAAQRMPATGGWVGSRARSAARCRLLRDRLAHRPPAAGRRPAGTWPRRPLPGLPCARRPRSKQARLADSGRRGGKQTHRRRRESTKRGRGRLLADCEGPAPRGVHGGRHGWRGSGATGPNSAHLHPGASNRLAHRERARCVTCCWPRGAPTRAGAREGVSPLLRGGAAPRYPGFTRPWPARRPAEEERQLACRLGEFSQTPAETTRLNTPTFRRQVPRKPPSRRRGKSVCAATMERRCFCVCGGANDDPCSMSSTFILQDCRPFIQGSPNKGTSLTRKIFGQGVRHTRPPNERVHASASARLSLQCYTWRAERTKPSPCVSFRRAAPRGPRRVFRRQC